MEKKDHPSLPSNYVTLAQLQERWLKKHSKTNQSEPEPEPQQPPLQKPQPPSTVSPTNAIASASASRSHRSKKYRFKKWNNPVTDRDAIKASTEDHDESEAGAGIEGETADQNIKACEFEKTRRKGSKRKPKQEGKSEGTVAAQGNEEEKAEKTAIGSELNDEKSRNSTMVEEVEQKFRVLETDSANGKQNGRFRNDFRHSQPLRNYHSGRGYGYNREQLSSPVRVQKSGKMVWVPKGCGIAEIET